LILKVFSSTYLAEYGQQNLPYSIRGLEGDELVEFDKFFTDFIARNGGSKIRPQKAENLTRYVYEKQQENYMSLARDFYGGFEFDLTNNLVVDIRNSRLAYFTSTATLNDANRFVYLLN
jgi:hypothetical protein